MKKKFRLQRQGAAEGRWSGGQFQAVRTGQQHGWPTHAKNEEKRKPGKLEQEGNGERAMCHEQTASANCLLHRELSTPKQFSAPQNSSTPTYIWLLTILSSGWVFLFCVLNNMGTRAVGGPGGG